MKASLAHSMSLALFVLAYLLRISSLSLVRADDYRNNDLPVPDHALFVIGDSSTDCGPQKSPSAYARANSLPYGRDFDTHRPTGRLCNGRITVDYLAQRLGLPFVPSYQGQAASIDDMINGVNYASAGGGIIFSRGPELGQHLSLTQQIQQVMDTFHQFNVSMGQDAAYDLVSNSIFYISIGTNDYIFNYFKELSNTPMLYLPWDFHELLVQTVKQAIKNLYYANVRNVVVMGLAPLGCAPRSLLHHKSINGECIEEMNDVILSYTFAMRYMVQQLNDELLEANIVFCDAFEGYMDIINNNDRYGFNVTKDACCGQGHYKGWIACISPSMACGNASTYLWWDNLHPTDAVNEILADNIWSSIHRSICYPMNLQELIAKRGK